MFCINRSIAQTSLSLVFSTAVWQAVACAPVTKRARVRSPVGASFLGEVFSGFSSPVRQMSGSFRPPWFPEYHLVIIIIQNRSLRAPMTRDIDAPYNLKYRLKPGEYGGRSRISHFQRRKRSVTAAAEWLLELSWRMMVEYCTPKCFTKPQKIFLCTTPLCHFNFYPGTFL